MGEQESVQHVALPLKDQLQSQFDHGTDIRLKMGIGAGNLKRRIPNLRRHTIKGPKDLLRVMCRENADKTAAFFFSRCSKGKTACADL